MPVWATTSGFLTDHPFILALDFIKNRVQAVAMRVRAKTSMLEWDTVQVFPTDHLLALVLEFKILDRAMIALRLRLPR